MSHSRNFRLVVIKADANAGAKGIGSQHIGIFHHIKICYANVDHYLHHLLCYKFCYCSRYSAILFLSFSTAFECI